MGFLLQGALGLGVFVAIAWLFSENRRAFPWRLAVFGILLQVALALLVLKLPWARDAFLALNRVVGVLAEATQAGTAFVFGYLGGGKAPFEVAYPEASFVLAFQALPLILVLSALSALLWYWGVLRAIVKAFTWALKRSLRIGGPAGVAAAANIFVGMVEAPILIRPVFARLTRPDLFLVMTTGMATIAGTVMVLYAAILGPVLPGALGHILTASILSVPAAAVIARIMLPAAGEASPDDERLPKVDYVSSMDAVTRGTGEGLELFLKVVAMLIVLVALVSLANAILAALPDVWGAPLTLQRILGWLFAPLAWCLGLPWEEATVGGQLMGTKTVLNELIAYLDLAALPPEALSERSRLILVYALCGFANLGSLGIMIGGLGALAPVRQAEVVALGGRSILAGTLATAMTGAVVGLIL
jgi:CNT family concentrative nucleoside transporter